MNNLINLLFVQKYYFKGYSREHFAILLLVYLGLFLFIKAIRKDSKKYSLRYVFITLFLIQQALLYSWYYFNASFDYHDSLPLYPCRIMQIVCIIALITKNKKLACISYLIAIPSAFIAMMVPDIEGYGFPNMMFVQFFLGHSLMLFSPIYLKYLLDFKIDFTAFKINIKIICIYFSVMLIFNNILKTNYGYVAKPPKVLGSLFDSIPYPVYFLAFFLVNIIIEFMFFKLAEKIEQRYEENFIHSRNDI